MKGIPTSNKGAKKFNPASSLVIGILIMLPFFLTTGQAFGYGKTHAFITQQAFLTWPADNNHEICKYLKPDILEMDTDGYTKLYNLENHKRPIDDDHYIGNTILEGVVEEDAGLRSKKISFPDFIPGIGGKSFKLQEWVDHFWNPDDNTKWFSVMTSLPLISCNVDPYCLTAFEKGAMWFTLAYSVYLEGNKNLAYYYLGRTAHCLEDMAVPAHVLNDLHVVNSDGYEKWCDENFTSLSIIRPNIWDLNSSELSKSFQVPDINMFHQIIAKLDKFARINCVAGESAAVANINNLKFLISSKIIKKIATNKIDRGELNKVLFNLKILFYNLAQATQHFPSDDAHGNNINLPDFAQNWPNIDQNWLMLENNLRAIATCLIPRTIQFTASLYHLFWQAVDTPPIIPDTAYDWPCFQQNLQNTGNNPYASTIRKPKQGNAVLLENIHSFAQPVVCDDIVYVSGNDGKLYATNPENRYSVWMFDTGRAIVTSAALGKNNIYVLSSNNKLFCLDKNTGHQNWVYDPGIPDPQWQTSPQVYGDYVCFTIAQLPFFIDKNTSIKVNHIQQPDFNRYQVIATPAIQNNIFYVQDVKCRVIAYAIPDGSILWHSAVYPGPENPGNMFGLATSDAVVIKDNLLILKNEWRQDFNNPVFQKGETGFIYALDINSHSFVWGKNIGFGVSAPVVKDNIIFAPGSRYFGDDPNINSLDHLETKIYYFDLRTGNLINSLKMNDVVNISIGANTLYLATWNSRGVIAVQVEPFQELWRKQLDGYPFAPVVPIKDKIYLSLLDYQGGFKPTSIITSSPKNIAITSLSEAIYQKGDVNGDGEITKKDASLILQFVVGKINLSFDALYAADFSQNGTITAYDAALILNKATK